jgi:hypothetical protein
MVDLSKINNTVPTVTPPTPFVSRQGIPGVGAAVFVVRAARSMNVPALTQHA